jgi:hypothetical protein
VSQYTISTLSSFHAGTDRAYYPLAHRLARSPRRAAPGQHEDGFGLAPSDEVDSPAGFAAWLTRLTNQSDPAKTIDDGTHCCTCRWMYAFAAPGRSQEWAPGPIRRAAAGVVDQITLSDLRRVREKADQRPTRWVSRSSGVAPSGSGVAGGLNQP